MVAWFLCKWRNNDGIVVVRNCFISWRFFAGRFEQRMLRIVTFKVKTLHCNSSCLVVHLIKLPPLRCFCWQQHSPYLIRLPHELQEDVTRRRSGTMGHKQCSWDRPQKTMTTWRSRPSKRWRGYSTEATPSFNHPPIPTTNFLRLQCLKTNITNTYSG